MLRSLLLLSALSFTAEALACSRSWVLSELSPILVPIYVQSPKPGLHGSMWTTNFLVHTGTLGYSNGACSESWPLIPGPWLGEHVTFPPVLRDHPTNPGRLLYMLRAVSGQHSYSLMVRDLTRQGESWGTEIPVVRESQFRTGQVQILNVPTDSRYRLSLRVYDPHATDRLSVVVRIFDPVHSAPIYEETLTLDVPDQHFFPEYNNSYPAFPGYAEIHDLVSQITFSQLPETIRIQIDSADPQAPYWAFATITNNETQHVTTITPQ